jgi:hypothetical protein
MSYSFKAFRSLPFVGIQDVRYDEDVDPNEPDFLEMRNCYCKSTIIIPLDERGKIWKRRAKKAAEKQ